MNKRHFVKLSNSVILFFEEDADEQVVSFGVWDNHNDSPHSYIGELGNWRVNIFSSSDLHLDDLNPDVIENVYEEKEQILVP